MERPQAKLADDKAEKTQKQGWDRDQYNAYQRGYMKGLRRGRKLGKRVGKKGRR